MDLSPVGMHGWPICVERLPGSCQGNLVVSRVGYGHIPNLRRTTIVLPEMDLAVITTHGGGVGVESEAAVGECNRVAARLQRLGHYRARACGVNEHRRDANEHRHD